MQRKPRQLSKRRDIASQMAAYDQGEKLGNADCKCNSERVSYDARHVARHRFALKVSRGKTYGFLLCEQELTSAGKCLLGLDKMRRLQNSKLYSTQQSLKSAHKLRTLASA